MTEYLVALSYELRMMQNVLYYVALKWLLQQKSLLRKVAYVCGKRAHHLKSGLLILSEEIF